MTVIALFDAGGKMGCRLFLLKATSFDVPARDASGLRFRTLGIDAGPSGR